MKHALKIAAPYLAVLVFWCGFRNAWLTILAYHAQMLFWSWRRLPLLTKGWNTRLFFGMALPCILAGPLAYVLLPIMTHAGGLPNWLADFNLTDIALVVMIPYFGLIHRLLEQAHWSGVRTAGWHAHLGFAGYHALVLYTLVQPVWLALCLLILFGASVFWSRLQLKTQNGLLIASCGHVLADIGIVLAAWARAG